MSRHSSRATSAKCRAAARGAASRAPVTGGALRRVGALVAVLALAGCGSSTNRLTTPAVASVPPTTSASEVSPSVGGTGASPRVSPSATATNATPVAVPVCALSALRVSEGASQGTAGSVVTDLDFTNVGKGTCTMEGFPRVSFLDSAGKQVGAPATRNPQPTTLVTLPPTVRGVSPLQVAEATNYATVDCRAGTVVALRVYPPGSRAAVLVPLHPHLQVCSTASQGAGGQQSHIAPVQSATR